MIKQYGEKKGPKIGKKGWPTLWKNKCFTCPRPKVQLQHIHQHKSEEAAARL